MAKNHTNNNYCINIQHTFKEGKMDKFKCNNCGYSFFEATDSVKKLRYDKDNRATHISNVTWISEWKPECGICGGGILYKVQD